MVRVRLPGLNVVRSKGRFYVYARGTGQVLVKGFDGDRAALQRHLESVGFVDQVQKIRKAAMPKTYAEGTLGGLVQWFMDENPRWQSLSDASRQDYRKSFDFLEGSFELELREITTTDVYDARNQAAKVKWNRFADKLVSCLSRMFRDAIPMGKMSSNPAAGVEKLHRNDPNANREWSALEWQAAIRAAPPHILTPLMIARYAGLRGQTIASLTWANYQVDPLYGRCFRVVARKNAEPVWLPILPILQDHLDSLDKTSTKIAVTSDGRPWKTEKQMQGAVSQYLRTLKVHDEVMEGATLHGLRVTYAAEMRREGSDAGQVAAALGDRSEVMGRHYTRHVEAEVKVIAAFGRKKPIERK